MDLSRSDRFHPLLEKLDGREISTDFYSLAGDDQLRSWKRDVCAFFCSNRSIHGENTDCVDKLIWNWDSTSCDVRVENFSTFFTLEDDRSGGVEALLAQLVSASSCWTFPLVRAVMKAGRLHLWFNSTSFTTHVLQYLSVSLPEKLAQVSGARVQATEARRHVRVTLRHRPVSDKSCLCSWRVQLCAQVTCRLLKLCGFDSSVSETANSDAQTDVGVDRACHDDDAGRSANCDSVPCSSHAHLSLLYLNSHEKQPSDDESANSFNQNTCSEHIPLDIGATKYVRFAGVVDYADGQCSETSRHLDHWMTIVKEMEVDRGRISCCDDVSTRLSGSMAAHHLLCVSGGRVCRVSTSCITSSAHQHQLAGGGVVFDERSLHVHDRQLLSAVYNHSRVRAILLRFEQLVDEGQYPPLPSCSDTLHSLAATCLSAPAEWRFIRVHLAMLPSLLYECAADTLRGQCGVHKLCRFICEFSRGFSRFYKSVRVLLPSAGSTRHFNTVHARIHLIHAVANVFECLFVLMGYASHQRTVQAG